MEFVFVIGIFCVAFPLLWCGIILLISRAGGWAALASHYGYSGPAKPPHKKFTSLSLIRLKFLPCNYSGIVSLAADDKALYMSVIKFFSIGHAPLRIPYDDLTISPYGTGFLSTGQLRTRRTDNLRIALRGKDLDWLQSIAGKLTPHI